MARAKSERVPNLSGAKSGVVPNLSGPVTPSAQKPVEGKMTKTDRAPMSTSEYSGHMKRKK